MTPDPLRALTDAIERIEDAGHLVGCSGAYPPHRCKCGLDEDLAALDAARNTLAAPRPDPLSEGQTLPTGAMVDQVRAFANGLKGDLGPGFGQDVVAVCDRHDYWQMSYEEEAELHGEAQAEIERLRTALDRLSEESSPSPKEQADG